MDLVPRCSQVLNLGALDAARTYSNHIQFAQPTRRPHAYMDSSALSTIPSRVLLLASVAFNPLTN